MAGLRLIAGMTDVLIEAEPTTAADDPGEFDFPDLAGAPTDSPPSSAPESVPEDQDSADGAGPARAEDDDRLTRRPSRHRQRAERTLIRRAVERSQALAAADSGDVQLLAAVLGSAAELPALTVAVLTAPRTATASLEDVLALRGMDRGDQMAEVAFMERPRALSLWSALSELGVVDRRRPVVDIAAAKATVASVAALSGADVTRVRRVVDLARGA